MNQSHNSECKLNVKVILNDVKALDISFQGELQARIA